MKLIMVLMVAAGLASCSLITDSDKARYELVVGFVGEGEDRYIAVPDTVAKGISFPVTVRTSGGGCTQKGAMEVRVRDLVGDVTPYDLELRGNAVPCQLMQIIHEHVGHLRFDRSGLAVVRITGRAGPQDSLVKIERTVVVQD